MSGSGLPLDGNAEWEWPEEMMFQYFIIIGAAFTGLCMIMVFYGNAITKYHWHWPGFQKNSVHICLLVLGLVVCNFLALLLPETDLLQGLAMRAFQALLMRSYIMYLLSFFDEKKDHVLPSHSELIDNCANVFKIVPEQTFKAPPCMWIFVGRKFKPTKKWLESCVRKVRQYVIVNPLAAYTMMICNRYGFIDTGSMDPKGAYFWLEVIVIIFTIRAMAGVRAMMQVIQPVILPDFHRIVHIKAGLFLFIIVILGVLQPLIMESIMTAYDVPEEEIIRWKAFVALCELLPITAITVCSFSALRFHNRTKRLSDMDRMAHVHMIKSSVTTLASPEQIRKMFAVKTGSDTPPEESDNPSGNALPSSLSTTPTTSAPTTTATTTNPTLLTTSADPATDLADMMNPPPAIELGTVGRPLAAERARKASLRAADEDLALARALLGMQGNGPSARARKASLRAADEDLALARALLGMDSEESDVLEGDMESGQVPPASPERNDGAGVSAFGASSGGVSALSEDGAGVDAFGGGAGVDAFGRSRKASGSEAQDLDARPDRDRSWSPEVKRDVDGNAQGVSGFAPPPARVAMGSGRISLDELRVDVNVRKRSREPSEPSYFLPLRTGNETPTAVKLKAKKSREQKAKEESDAVGEMAF